MSDKEEKKELDEDAAEEQAEREQKLREVGEEESAFRRATINDQCFLLDNIKALITTPPAKYSSLSVVEGDPSEVYTRLTSRTGLSPLMDIRTEELALIKPTIRFFKQRYKKSADGEKHEPILDDNKNPIMEELIFQDFHNTTNASILGPNAIASGIGLKSVDYELKGGNPEYGKRNNQTVTVVFWMESLKSLTDTTCGPAFVELVSDPSTKMKTVDAEGKVTVTNELNPAYRSLHMLYGWGSPNETSDLIRPHVKRALRSTSVLLKLSLVSAEFDLNQNGTATMTVKYTAHQEASRQLAKKDVLRPDKAFQRRIKELEAQHQQRTERVNSANKNYQDRRARAIKTGRHTEETYTDGGFLDTIDVLGIGEGSKDEQHEEWQKEQAKASRDRIRQIKREKLNAKEKMYSAFLEKLEKSRKLFYVDVPSKDFIQNQYQRHEEKIDAGYEKMNESEKRAYDEARATNHRPLNLSPQAVTDRSSAGSPSTLRENQRRHFERERQSVQAEQDADDDGDERDPIEPESKFAAKNSAKQRVGKDTKRIYFMRFGDLLNTAIAHLEHPDESTVAVGPIVWNDAGTGQPVSRALVDIPISLEYFQVWWIENVVTKQLERWSLDGFLRSAVGNLIVNVLGTKCFYGSGKVTGKVSTALVDNVLGTGMKPPLKKGERVSAKTIPIKSGGDMPGMPSFSYLYIYCHTFTMNSLEGNKPEDAKKGIYHFSVGDSKGLVKEVGFKKSGNNKVDSARMLRNMSDNPNDEIGLGRLHSQYNAELTLVGNSLFKPGQFIYINPSIRGLGDIGNKNSIARQIGLGGYFLITKVSGQIGPEGWTTQLGTVWQSFGSTGKGAPTKADTTQPMESSMPETSPSDSPVPMSTPDIPMSGG